MSFVHLHLHTQYSLLDGANKISEIVSLAQSKGQPAIAITDHGNMHGILEFYEKAKKQGIKPIIGCELYVTPGSRHDRRTKAQGGAGTNHLTVLAKDMEGYQNLCRLVSLGFKEGFYFKPRVDHELLERYSRGLIALSGCMNSELNSFTSIDGDKEAKSLVEYYSNVFDGRYFLEVQPHALDDQRKLNQMCWELSQRLGIPLVATNDCHYPNVEDHHAQEVLMCISTGKKIDDPTRIRHENVALYLKTRDEMLSELSSFSGGEEAVRNTLEIAEMCNVDFDLGRHYMPRYTQDVEDSELIKMMAKMARDGLSKRLEVIEKQRLDWCPSLKQEYVDRLEQEIELIDKMGFAGYFLVVSDFIVWAKEQGIPVGPGRGSVAGSLVAFAMRITEVDPISNKLIFERFLNPERVSLPDIDVDFCIYGRDKVIKYVSNKYGADRVAQIATFGTLKAKQAIKDVGRVMGLSYGETDRIAQLIPAPRQGFDFSIEESLKMEKRLADYAKGEGKELISLAKRLEGLTRHSSTHAAGVVIGDRPLTDLLPLMVDKDGNDVTQFSMSYVEKIGLVKFDFLGLKTLTVINTALSIIQVSKGVSLDPDLLPLTDSKTFSLLASGNTTGVFQLESTGITEMTMRLKPTCFDDLVAILALYRPGPLDAGMVDHYINRKHGREQISYLHPKMSGILADTYGIILYQEQIMQLARELAGYSLGEADILRKAMGKKNPEEMAKQRDRFMKGAKDRAIDLKLASQIFDQMETFARYGFNRSHSAAYALVSFQTAYLKAHYPVEFMAALMSHETDDSDKVLKNLNECRKQKIQVLPPAINESIAGFSVVDNAIRFGLSAVKAVGEKAIQEIIDKRNEEGAYKSLEEFATRVDLKAMNKRAIDNLIKCGAFDFCDLSRRELSEKLEEVVKFGQALQKDKSTNQMSLFSAEQLEQSIPEKRLNLPEWPINRKLNHEREALGFYISGHPVEKYWSELKRLGALTTQDLKKLGGQKEVRVGGVITALKLRNTKKGDRYASFILEDWLGTVETLIWPDTYKNSANLVVSEEPIIITGDLDCKDERRTLIGRHVESLITARDRTATVGLLQLNDGDEISSALPKLSSIFARYAGQCPLKVLFTTNSGQISMVLRDEKQTPVCVSPSEELCEEVEQVVGRPVLAFM